MKNVTIVPDEKKELVKAFFITMHLKRKELERLLALKGKDIKKELK